MYDICWLDCTIYGMRIVSGGSEIFLCPDHTAEMKSTAAGGYKRAQPPKNSRATKWPWRKLVKV